MKKAIFRTAVYTLLAVIIGITLAHAAPFECSAAGQAGADGSWFGSTAKFLVNPYLRIALLTIGLLGLMVEIITLSAMAGAIGMFALVLFFVSHMALGLITFHVLLLFLIGIAFLALEIFVIPGHGISGVIGILATFTSILIAMWDPGHPYKSIFSVLISVAISGAIFALILKYLPKSKTWKRFSLDMRQSSADGYVSRNQQIELEGARGVAISDLRPSGTALINDERIDVVTDGGYIKKDTPVCVVKVEGIRIIVKAIEGAP